MVNLIYLASELYGQESGDNFRGIQILKWVNCALYSLMNVILIDQFTHDIKYKILNIGAEILAIWICIITNCFQYQLTT